jgi:hypothetical protein
MGDATTATERAEARVRCLREALARLHALRAEALDKRDDPALAHHAARREETLPRLERAIIQAEVALALAEWVARRL